MTTTDSSTVEIRGSKVMVHRAGSGPPLLYLHGIDGAPPARAVMDRLARDFHVLLPEHPGFGLSDTPAWLDTIHDLAYFYLDLLHALELRDVHVAGHNLGGWIALEIAVRTIERLRTLTLIGSAGIHVKGVAKGDLFMRAPDIVLRSMFADPSRADPILARTPTRAEEDILIKNRFAVARVGWHPPLFDPHLAKWLHRLALPVHIVWGDTDRIFPIDYAHEFHRLIPGSRMTVLPACGHAAHIEKPEALAAAIAAFVTERAR
jgi:pimeloyl-ACP methyl ester carboxylesterase